MKKSIDEIKAMHIATEDCAVFREFDQGTLEKKKDDLYELSRELLDEENEFSQIKKEYNEKLKNLKKRRNTVVEEVNRGGFHKTEMCYCIPDYEDKTMNYYSGDGILAKQRRMTKEEQAVSTDILRLSTGTGGKE